jgi:RNA polymerase sigma-70 factor (ECF subfamily)
VGPRDEVDRSFERFQKSGDTEALGRVFDATAPRLLQLAIHLVGDLAAAEDLVQATFVTAIERAATFDASRNLESWLAGILANHARDLTKSARREIDVASLVERVEATPLEHALDAEWSAALAEALDRVPEPYRVVLILRLQHGMEPTEIAHALQRSPGAVRVQLHRGRELLRKLLPAGLVASAMFIAEPGRGLAQVKANVVAHAAIVKSSVGVAGIVGGLLMSTKVLISGAVILVALLALFLLRGREHETAQASVSMPAQVKQDATTHAAPREEIALTESTPPVQREEAVLDSTASHGRLVKVHGRVFDVDTDSGIAGADVRFYSPQSARLSDIRRRWHDRLEVYPDGSVYATGWPRFGAIPAGQSRADTEFGTNFTNETRLSTEDLTLYAPPPPDARPIGRVVTDASGEFEIPVPESLGFIVCNASGYAMRERAVAPAEVNKANADIISIRIAMRAAKPLAGYVVDENLKRIERRVHLRFDGHVNKPAPVAQGSAGPSGIEADLQMDAWTVETNADGSFECALPAKIVYARCIEPDFDVVKQGHLRDDGTTFVHDVWPEPGQVTEPLVIVLQSVASLVVRDRETQAPIEDIHLQCTRDSNGFPLRFGRFFSPHGRMRLARVDAVSSATNQREDELSSCECTVWADGYLPATKKLHDLTRPGVTEFELQRGELPAIAGRVHDGSRALDSARISIAPPGRGTWTPPGGIPIEMTKTDGKGEFRVGAPSGRYVLGVVAGELEEYRIIDLPSSAPIDVDFSIDTEIVADLHDSSGAASSGHEVLLLGLDGRRVKRNTDSTGTVSFTRLSPGGYSVQIMNPSISVSSKPDQEFPIEVHVGDRSRAEFVIPLERPRFARLVVDGSPILAGWKARYQQAGTNGPWVNVELDGRIPIDIRGKRVFHIGNADAREWTVILPSGAADGHEIRISLDGIAYEGIVTSQATGRPLKGLRVNARRWIDSGATGIIATAVTDDQGRFKVMGLADEEYSISFDGGRDPYSFEQEGIFLHAERPRSPAAQLAIALPRRKGPLFGGYGGRGYDGVPESTLSGTARRSTGPLPRINCWLGSLFPRDGYTLILYTWLQLNPDGTYEVSVPAARKYRASLRDGAEGLAELEWDASGTGNREVHDFELP